MRRLTTYAFIGGSFRHSILLPPHVGASNRRDTPPYYPFPGGLFVSHLHEHRVQTDPIELWASVLCEVLGEDAEAEEGQLSDVSVTLGVGR